MNNDLKHEWQWDSDKGKFYDKDWTYVLTGLLEKNLSVYHKKSDSHGWIVILWGGSCFKCGEKPPIELLEEIRNFIHNGCRII